ncbi:MAG: hypothetical protein AB1644_03980 [Candidatus Zixiibacteriota bacterium]
MRKTALIALTIATCWLAMGGAETSALDPCCVGSTGDMNGDGVVDIGDLDCIVSPLFFGIWPPNCCMCSEECDINSDGSMDISDLQMLIDFLFFGANLPNCPF